MPTPMTIEMENEMTKDEIQAAIKFINDKFDQDYIETEEYYHIFKYHGDTIRAALQSQLTKNDENVTCGNLSNVPDGYVLVPKEPTGAQIMACIHCLERNDDLPDIGYGPKAVRIYKNMIGAL